MKLGRNWCEAEKEEKEMIREEIGKHWRLITWVEP